MNNILNYKKKYLICFLFLILPPIFIRVLAYLGYMFLSQEIAAVLTIITKIGMIILTIWYGLKVGLNFWAWVLGLSTLFPIMPWISLIILLSKKIDDTNTGIPKQPHAIIRNELEKMYIPIIKMITSMAHSDAKIAFNNMYKQVVEESKKEGTINLPVNYGDELLAKENSDEQIKEMLVMKRGEGVTDKDIKWWWNMHDYERRIMLKVDELCKLTLFINKTDNGYSQKDAAESVRKFHPMYGNPDDTTHTKGINRPLPYELKDRINIYIERRMQKDPDNYKNEIENSSTFNCLIRKEIKAGKT